MRTAPQLCALCGGVGPTLVPCVCKAAFHGTCHSAWRWLKRSHDRCVLCEQRFVLRDAGLVRSWLYGRISCLVIASVALVVVARSAGVVFPILSSLVWNAVVNSSAAVTPPTQRAVESISILILFLPTLVTVLTDREMGSVLARMLSAFGLFVLHVTVYGFWLVVPYSFWASGAFLHRQLAPFRSLATAHTE